MVEFPPYVKLVVDNTMRKDAGSVQKTSASAKMRKGSQTTLGTSQTDNVQSSQTQGDVVSLVSRENRRAWETQPPTLREAEDALDALARDLPEYQQDAGDVHSFLDRRVILSLLAPLVM